MGSGNAESVEPASVAARRRLPVWTWVFIVWILLVITRAIAEGVENVGRGRATMGTVKLLLAAVLAWGIVLLFQRRPLARHFWLALLGVLSALCVWLAILVPSGQRDALLAGVLWLASWALYFVRSRRLLAVLHAGTKFAAPPV